jgi:hypothetical protein
VHNLATPPTTDPEISSALASYDDSDASSLSSIASSVAALSDITSSDGLSDIDSVADDADREVDTAGDGDASGVRVIIVEEGEVVHDGITDADVESEHGSLVNSLWSETWFNAEHDPNTTVTDAAMISHIPSSIPLGRRTEETTNNNDNNGIANGVTPRIARRITPLRSSAWEGARSGGNSSPSRSPARREKTCTGWICEEDCTE